MVERDDGVGAGLGDVLQCPSPRAGKKARKTIDRKSLSAASPGSVQTIATATSELGDADQPRNSDDADAALSCKHGDDRCRLRP